jgi:hypothetical protein
VVAERDVLCSSGICAEAYLVLGGAIVPPSPPVRTGEGESPQEAQKHL